jgi:hypothetical protein
MRSALTFLLLLASFSLIACSARRSPNQGDDDDDDSAGDDDDATGDDDDAADDDDDDGGVACDGIILTLAGSGAECDVPWTEGGASIELTNHCISSACSGDQAEGDVWIYPAMLSVDFDSLDCTVTRVEVDLTDFGGPGTATVTLLNSSSSVMDASANSGTGAVESMVLTATSGVAGSVAICGSETQVHEIRLY